MYFEVSLVPKDLIIEAENEEELKEMFKKITIENLIFSYPRISKEKFEKILKQRHIYLKS